MSLRWLQKFLGHANLQTTLVYPHLTDPKEQDGRDTLNEIAQPGELFEKTDDDDSPDATPKKRKLR